MTHRPAAPDPGPRRWTAWLPAIAWAALIFALSSRSSVPLPSITHLDKLAHFGAYAVLGLCLAHGQHVTGWLSTRWIVALGVLYGASDEFHQSFVPGRATELGDLVADALGVVAGVAAYRFWLRRRARPAAPAGRAAPTPLAHD